MKCPIPLMLLFSLLATSVWGNTDWKSFDNADKTKSFIGRLVGYDSKKEIVTVQRKSTMRPVRFKVGLLSPEHQEYVKARAIELEAASRLRMMFYETVEKVDSNRTSDTRTSKYNGGYRIEIASRASEMIENVDVEYILVYRKDATEGRGEIMTKTGSTKISTLIPNFNTHVTADGIPLTSYYKKGKVTGSLGRGST